MKTSTLPETNFAVLVETGGSWYKSGVVSYKKNKHRLCPVSKKNFAGENKKRLMDSCLSLLEGSSNFIEWVMTSGKTARTYKLNANTKKESAKDNINIAFPRSGKLISLVRSNDASRLTKELKSQGFICIKQNIDSIVFQNYLFDKSYSEYANNPDLPGIVVDISPVRNKEEWLYALNTSRSVIAERFPIPLVVISDVITEDKWKLSHEIKEYNY